ncbi:outer membrane protein [Urechidicola croceus]|uniref:Outer membrane protein beta-barrel domain-containing protein n=1 Tax=Urechidicola croceus TaxID=1850246 RepID=A0A1D8P7Q2_9FLAO|nr:outer membrane beta-barrel protein [Urechidicola croceus]AOW20581.1 hypothetical protein LPB138_07770 [Urechidicola croceus]
MKKKLLLTIAVLFSLPFFAQYSNFSIELNYPIPIDKNFIGKNFNGIADLGFKYKFSSAKTLNIGASINSSLLANKTINNRPSFELTVFSIQPRLFAELSSETLENFRPSIGLGYTFMIFSIFDKNNFNPQNPNGPVDSETYSGLNLNLGMSYDISNQFYGQIQYDFVKLGSDSDFTDSKYNSNVNILKIGVGYRL